jgi:hypothetical protein
MKLQKLGGWAAIALVCVIVIQVGVGGGMLRGMLSTDFVDPVKMIMASQDSPVAFLVYALLGIMIAILTLLIALTLRERMRAEVPNIMSFVVITASVYFALYLTCQMSGIFSSVFLVGNKDISAYRAFLFLHECLGYTAVHAWGWGLLMLGAAILKTHALPRILGYIMLAYGIVGIFQFAFAVSPLLQLGWGIWMSLGLIGNVWLGVVLLRKPAPIPAQT